MNPLVVVVTDAICYYVVLPCCVAVGVLQVVIAMLITLAGLRVLAGLRPYRREDENNLAEASIWITFLTL